MTELSNLYPPAAAKSAGLKYINDSLPGIRREGKGKKFKYVDSNGKIIRDKKTLQRIQALVIPPAWKNVWICAFENGHIQCVGWDARNRKQYKYHSRWREVRDQTKYDKMIGFAHALPKIRNQIKKDLSHPGLPKVKVVATVVRLLETTLIRVGNEEYAKENRSFGLTTMYSRHVKIKGKALHFKFRGKSGIDHSIDVEAPWVSHIVKKCHDLPGRELFQYVDAEGNHHPIDSHDVNSYLHEVAGEQFTAKDFRTWAGTVHAASTLQGFDELTSVTQKKKNIVQTIEQVAKRLGNTKAVCRKCYIHPAVLEAYLNGNLTASLKQAQRSSKKLARLSAEEKAVLSFLKMQKDYRPRLQK